MNTESVIRQEPAPQRLVQWFPPAGAVRSLSPDLVTAASIAAGVFLTTGFAIGVYYAARAHSRYRKLEVDRLVVRRLHVLEDAARYQ